MIPEPPVTLGQGPSATDAAAALQRLEDATPYVGEAGSRQRWDYIAAGIQIKARLETTADALELPLLFHAGGPWDDAKRARWKALTGTEEATTRVMCDAIRRVLADAAGPGKG